MVSSINYRYPTLERLDSHPEYGDKNNKSAVSSFIAKRHKAQYREVNTQDKIKSGIGAVVGTIIPMLFMMKKKWEFYWKQTLINMWCRKKYLFRILINIFYKK